ncbi:SRPBCC family protein [Leptospira sp. 2 VSF19]|uniref:SRPBCC family protein n=1 Tax=Leptospira soteropolitanensis TaxID=2950025 RepID=A0AAW5VH55_9LEPT|nr:SRPBCC family protein [Leptospira soteropolitanensis]MCW7493579.1 SRPBCC family protein [Leptospira soteropolitanensis]MCW7501178.1 SRPBCC family protein [Leptospira soteropolitanensis]MCW7523636.1 SRPBCC family protein [Leptospira soteropolitanensis]MCW7527291.1 SRPBCC family protein [Leptospira soteropolitanensis]MCW7531148.1 SRPBCC family protein [Leptospira soteropolitanensis]
MKEKQVRNSTFTIERILPASKERAFGAWSNPESKRRWFACHDDWKTVEFSLDFQVGGKETNLVLTPAGSRHVFDATYYDIIPNERIIYAFGMYVNDIRISVSLVTVLFESEIIGRTKMIFTEQIVFLQEPNAFGFSADDEIRGRVDGTNAGFDRLEKELT